jgi:hypothetical protein
MLHKTERTKEEILLLDPLVTKIILYIDAEFPGQTITGIMRTQQEQDVIYKDDPKYIVEKFTSVHQIDPESGLVRGVDMRFIEGVSLRIEDVVNNGFVYDEKRPSLKCALIHEIIDPITKESFGKHLHVQANLNFTKVMKP